MSLSISTTVDQLNIYVDQNRDALISGAVAGAKSAQLLNLQVGYKSSGSINIMDTDVVFQLDASGRTPSGTTSLTQRVLAVAPIKIEEDIDVKALNAIYQQHNLKAGSADDVVPFEQAWTELKVKKVSNELEKLIWAGDTGWTGTNNLNRFNGFLEVLRAESSVIGVGLLDAQTIQITTAPTADEDVTISFGAVDVVVAILDADTVDQVATKIQVAVDAVDGYTATVSTDTVSITGAVLATYDAGTTGTTATVTSVDITKGNTIAIVEGVYEGISDAVLESGEAIIVCGFDFFRMYQSALKDANLFHYSADSTDFELPIAGTNVKLIALQGLTGTQAVLSGKPENFVIGTDLANEEEEFDVWYSKEDKIVKLDITFKYGVQVAFPEEITLYDGNPAVAS